jgi:hypothetical protein
LKKEEEEEEEEEENKHDLPLAILTLLHFYYNMA